MTYRKGDKVRFLMSEETAGGKKNSRVGEVARTILEEGANVYYLHIDVDTVEVLFAYKNEKKAASVLSSASVVVGLDPATRKEVHVSAAMWKKINPTGKEGLRWMRVSGEVKAVEVHEAEVSWPHGCSALV